MKKGTNCQNTIKRIKGLSGFLANRVNFEKKYENFENFEIM